MAFVLYIFAYLIHCKPLSIEKSFFMNYPLTISFSTNKFKVDFKSFIFQFYAVNIPMQSAHILLLCQVFSLNKTTLCTFQFWFIRIYLITNHSQFTAPFYNPKVFVGEYGEILSVFTVRCTSAFVVWQIGISFKTLFVPYVQLLVKYHHALIFVPYTQLFYKKNPPFVPCLHLCINESKNLKVCR